MIRVWLVMCCCISAQAAQVSAEERQPSPPDDSRLFSLSYSEDDVTTRHEPSSRYAWAPAEGDDHDAGAAAPDVAAPDVDADPENADEETADQGPEMISLIELPDYSGDFRTSKYLTGDWGGARTDLANNGILFQFDLVQVFQHNAYGGRNTSGAVGYSGSVDYAIKFDTARMGLWPAGLLYLKGETQFGRGVNRDVGAAMVANADNLFPIPNDPGATTLTDVVFTQFLSEKVGFAIGKIDFRGGDQNVFAHDENTQFMNLAFLANPALLHLVPYSSLTAAVFFRPVDWIIGSVGVLDSFGRPDTPGFDTAFHSPRGTTFLTEWTFNIRPFGLPGHQRAGAAYSNRELTALNQDPRFNFVPLNLISFLLSPVKEADDWAVYYNFDQYLYTEPDDPEQGIGIFGRFGWSTGDASPIAQFYSIGIGGQGVVPTRDKDTFGAGYYYVNFSDDLPSVLGISFEQGVELYYNIEVTPWLHVTPDFQVIIDPAIGRENVAIAYGLRAHMSL